MKFTIPEIDEAKGGTMEVEGEFSRQRCRRLSYVAGHFLRRIRRLHCRSHQFQ